MLDLLKIESEIQDDPKACALAVPADASSVSIEFKNVSFSYNPERPILKDVSFTIPGRYHPTHFSALFEGKAKSFQQNCEAR